MPENQEENLRHVRGADDVELAAIVATLKTLIKERCDEAEALAKYEELVPVLLRAIDRYRNDPIPSPRPSDAEKEFKALRKMAKKYGCALESLSVDAEIWLYQELELGTISRSRSDMFEVVAATERILASGPRDSGGPSVNPLTEYVARLVEIYEVVIGQPAGRSWDEYKRKPTGPLFRFVQPCVNSLRPKTKDSTLDSTIRRVLESRKKRDAD